MMQEENHIFLGLRRDNHLIRLDSKFLWDAHNIRLTNRDDSTLLSITNEKGPKKTSVEFSGYYVGHCIVGKYLVVFTSNQLLSNASTNTSHIYRVERVGDSFKTIVLYQYFDVLKRQWNASHPIEALGVYETELVQKVYWIDGINQPRVINVAKPELTIPENEWATKIKDGTNFGTSLYQITDFDFVQTLQLEEEVSVKKISGYGEFAPGVVQYALTYFNKYGQESNIFWTTPLYYAAPEGRGASPEEKVACSFTVRVSNPDDFDYVRIYSIHRTSLDAVPTVKIVADLPLDSSATEGGTKYVEYTDTGTVGTTVDPTQLLYIGGTYVVPQTMVSKDGTLFLGNLEVNNTLVKEAKQALEKATLVNAFQDITTDITSPSGVYYKYSPSLTEYNAGFKVGETYRCGVQVQDKYGKWSEPIWIKDDYLNESSYLWNSERRATKAVSINSSILQVLRDNDYKRIRPCVVFPRTFEREVICQGVLCPTVFSVQGRSTNTIFSASSWFFRPATNLNASLAGLWMYNGARIQYQHNKPLFTGGDRGAEVQSMVTTPAIASITSTNADEYSSSYFVDENIVTFHSPDLEFDTSLHNFIWDNVKLRVVGIASLGAISGDIDIETSTPVLNTKSDGFKHRLLGYLTGISSWINGGLVAGLFYEDGIAEKQDDGTVKVATSSSQPRWMVYPWHRSGSLNNDEVREENKGTRSAVLSKKKISNLKFFDKNRSFSEFPIKFENISAPQLFNSNELMLQKVRVPYLGIDASYLGNMDTMATPGTEYGIYRTTRPFTTSSDNITAGSDTSKEPVRIKYKSTPHLVFSLGQDGSQVCLLPRHKSLPNEDTNSLTIPDWFSDNSSDNDNSGGGGGTGGGDDGGGGNQGGGDDNNPGGNTQNYDYIILIYSDGCPPVASQYNPTNINAVGRIYYLPTRVVRDGGREDAGKVEYTDEKWFILEGTSQSSLTLKEMDDIEGKIGKIVSGISQYKVQRGTGQFPGTNSENYPDGATYIGEDKYYKIGSGGRLTEVDVTAPDSYSTKSYASAASRATGLTVRQPSFGSSSDNVKPYLLIAELYRDKPSTKFGGDADLAKLENLWIPAGDPVSIVDDSITSVILPYIYGDTWYSRYDCLKTYPFTQEDENSVVEIGSFLCETRVNIDGRYDRNRGLISNLTMSPQNFNLLNDVYSQLNTTFNYRVLDEDYYKSNTFANLVTWSTEKQAGSDVDPWTNITLASTLDMDGSKGVITKLAVFNETLMCFQERALSQILFNSRVQIPASDGVPIEISNGYKVDGSRILSDTVGCLNKWSVCNTKNGVYFIDTNTDTLWLFNGLLNNLSETLGMKWWFQKNHSSRVWTPQTTNDSAIRTFYDPGYGDVYFTPGYDLYDSTKQALCFSEQLGQFVSQYDYTGTAAMFLFGEGFFSIRTGTTCLLWENFKGDYNDFFGTPKGWSISFISNDNPTLTKVFDTVELRADHFWTFGTTQLLNNCPINYIAVENEYQRGSAEGNKVDMKKKFRVWRGLLPRVSETSHGFRNQCAKSRLRNPWTMITLGWNPTTGLQPGNSTRKAVIHDVSVKYTI